jgi:hypothetical protein
VVAQQLLHPLAIPASTTGAITTAEKQKPVEEWVQPGSGYEVVKIDALRCSLPIDSPHNVLQVHDVSDEMPTSTGARVSFENIPLKHIKVTQ